MASQRYIDNLIANLRALPEDWSRSYLRPEKPISKLMDGIIDKHHIGVPSPEEELMAHWEEVMGAHLAPRCRPERINAKNALVIIIANPVLRSEVQFQQRSILQRLRQIPQCQHINKLILKG